jgi:aromatic ring-opening dioxygenase catalytic subunit (LigB family)
MTAMVADRQADATAGTRQPALYIPHGGGPCFFMDDPHGTWTAMAGFLRDIPSTLPGKPKAILLISGHWETRGFTLTSSERPPLIYDYYGFPPHTYEIRYDAPGDPALAARGAGLLREAGMTAALDPVRGYDHGVFVPLKVAFPDADVPIVQMSVEQSFDPALHMAAGHALAPLRDEGVLIVGSGMSFHNMRGYGNPAAVAPSTQFDRWLTAAAEAEPGERARRLAAWDQAPAGRLSHPREEHLIPLMVAAGASDAPGRSIFNGEVMNTIVSGFRFD